MTADQEITQWEDSGSPYLEGVELYKKYGFSQVLKNILSKGPNTYNVNKLNSELSKIKSRNTKKVKPKVKKPKKQSTMGQNQFEAPMSHSGDTIPYVTRYSEVKLPGINFKDLPDQLKYETQVRISLYREASVLHYKLDQMKSQQEIKQATQKILDNFVKIDQLWDRIDYYIKHKIVLPQVDDRVSDEVSGIDDPVQMFKKLQNIRVNISKAKRKLQTLSDTVKIANLNQKVAHWEIEKDYLERKINGNQ